MTDGRKRRARVQSIVAVAVVAVGVVVEVVVAAVIVVIAVVEAKAAATHRAQVCSALYGRREHPLLRSSSVRPVHLQPPRISH